MYSPTGIWLYKKIVIYKTLSINFVNDLIHRMINDHGVFNPWFFCREKCTDGTILYFANL